MNIISIILRSLGYLLVALIVLISSYIILNSGIYHTPKKFLTSSDYVTPSNKILIVGGTRGVGLEIIKKLLDRGEDVTAMVRSTSNVEKLTELGVKQVIADALIKEQVQAIFSQNNFGTVISTLGTSAKDLPGYFC